MTQVEEPLPQIPFEIPRPLVEQIRRQARDEYPGECCGLLFAAAGAASVARVVPMENLQDRLHALDPETHPRTSRNGFHMDALRVWREIEAAERRGEQLLGFYHSHIDCDAYFSGEDRIMAAPPPARLPMYPEAWHLIVSCWPDGVHHARAFRWDGHDFAPYAVGAFGTAASPAGR